MRATLNYVGIEVIEGRWRWVGQFTTVLKFNPAVHEYRNGSGGNTITAVWGSSNPHSIQTYAQRASTELIAQRDTSFDDREAIVLLENETWDLFEAESGEYTYFLN